LDHDQELEDTVAFLPDLVSRVMHENNHMFKSIPRMKQKPNQFQQLIEDGNGTNETNRQPGRSLILQNKKNNMSSDSNHLISNEEVQPISPTLPGVNEDSVENDYHILEEGITTPADNDALSDSDETTNPSKHPLRLKTQLFTESLVDRDRQDENSSEIILGLPPDSKLECSHSHDRDSDSLSPQTMR